MEEAECWRCGSNHEVKLHTLFDGRLTIPLCKHCWERIVTHTIWTMMMDRSSLRTNLYDKVLRMREEVVAGE